MKENETIIIQAKENLTIQIKNENHTKEELKQKIINYLYDLDVNSYDILEIELIKTIFNKKRNRNSNPQKLKKNLQQL